MAIEERITLPTLNDIKLNEEYTQLAPKLSEREYESLKESIRTNGLHYAIAINNDNILLDGHHRKKPKSKTNVDPSETTYLKTVGFFSYDFLSLCEISSLSFPSIVISFH